MLRASVLIPSYRRPQALLRCLSSLARQTVPPLEVIVVWQADDLPTRDAALLACGEASFPIRIRHSKERGVVPAENTALAASSGEVVLLIDDDAVAPPGWVERHLSFYEDPAVGAVGGSANNFRPDDTPFPRRSCEPVGRLRFSGRLAGNMFDHPEEWRARRPAEADHLVGYNMSLRRRAFDRFETELRPYWQMFEADACLQARERGYRVVFDFGNQVSHYPTNTAYVSGREGDLDVKIFNGAFNHAFVLARHSRGPVRWIRLLWLLAVGSGNAPGIAAAAVCLRRYGRPLRELAILFRTWRAHLSGWTAGSRRRKESRAELSPSAVAAEQSNQEAG